MTAANTGKKAQGASPRTGAELVTLIISAVLLVGLIGSLIAVEVSRGHARAGLQITPHYDKAFERDGEWYLPVDVTNSGDEPTDTVRVELVRPVAGEAPEVAELEFTFVAGGEQVSGFAVFDEEPTAATIDVDAISYTDP